MSLLLVLLACPPLPEPPSSDPVDPPESQPEADSPPACDAELLEVSPDPADPDADPAAGARYTLSAPDPTASLEADVAGVTTVSDDFTAFTWTPTDPDAAWNVHFSWCGGQVGSVSAAPVELALLGRTWYLGSEWELVDPPGLGALFGNQDVGALFHVSEQVGEAVTLGAAPAMPGMTDQNYCLVSTILTGTLRRDQLEASGDVVWATLIGETATPIHDLRLSATVEDDGVRLSGGTARGTLDARELVDATGLSAGGMCALAALFGAPCEPCADGEDRCLTLEFGQMGLDAVPGAVLPVEIAHCQECGKHWVPADECVPEE